MKALDDTLQTPQRESAAADLAARVTAIFRSMVAEHRARVQLEGELCLADVAVFTLPAFRATQEFCDQIAYVLLDLMEEQPDVLDLLSGRTFARTIH